MDGRDRKKRAGSQGEGAGKREKMGVRFREERGLECGWKALSGDTKLNLTSSPHTCRKQQSREALSHSHSLTAEAGDGGGEGVGFRASRFLTWQPL